MDVKGVKEAMLELTKYYFQNATVMFGQQSHIAKQGKPLVKLYTGVVTRSLNPPTKIIDGRPVSFYPSTVPVQIDLFTMGQKKELGHGFTPVMENTAADDMLSFVNFLNSEVAIQYCHQKDIAIVVSNTVQDLTGLINDTSYEYRAMIEVMVYFTSTAVGYSGTLAESSITVKAGSSNADKPTSSKPTGGSDWIGSIDMSSDGDSNEDEYELTPEVVKTPSGGGNEKVLDNEQEYFSNVIINKQLVKEEKQ